MRLIVDANCFGLVFNASAKDQSDFAPVFNWIMTGHSGRLIYGGTKYKKEVDFKPSRNRGVLVNLRREVG